ncbi:MAG: hypothetical protein Q9197_006061 [Variospora fuerteventurae]
MTPAPDAKDALDSLSSSTHSERSFSESRQSATIQQLSRFALDKATSAPVSAHLSSRSNSRHNHEQQSSGDRRSFSPYLAARKNGDIREAILASFAPRVSVLASEDTDDIARDMGFTGGFYSLLRPFGEDVPGKIIVRDSAGASKAWDNFSIRLVNNREIPDINGTSVDRLQAHQERAGHVRPDQNTPSEVHKRQDFIDAVLDKSLPSTKLPSPDQCEGNVSNQVERQSLEWTSSTYNLYLRQLLHETLLVPHETFTHPVACLIAVSSRSQRPLEMIRQLYSATGRSNPKIPAWVGVDYLRYYVLVHDEDRDDISTSTALFDLMKRHFGLHCCLLRLRSKPCASINEDRVSMPRCRWISLEEDLAGIGETDVLDARKWLFASDAASVKGFIRELVTQSIIPFMEGRIVTWNDQVASKRRGIGGRFMSLSKRWAGFGQAKGSNSTITAGPGLSNSNFDHARGYYLPETPEAIMRQLADYAFMLRDYKLAFDTYDSLRTDFNTDKAWLYHASACELTCVSFLLMPQTLSNKSRSEIVDQKLDAALYSYLTRSSIPACAVRAVILVAELLLGRGPAAAVDAARWTIRLLDLGILNPLPQALLTERVADIHLWQSGSGGLKLGSRRRRAVLWNILASSLWAELGRASQAISRLRDARTIMGLDLPFPTMHFMFKGFEQGTSDVQDKKLMLFSTSAAGDHRENLIYEMKERLDQHSPPYEPHLTDAGGFSTLEASNSGLEDTWQ